MTDLSELSSSQKLNQEPITCQAMIGFLLANPQIATNKLVVYCREVDKWYDITQIQIDHKVLILRPDEENPR